jgi:hypothetical protein
MRKHQTWTLLILLLLLAACGPQPGPTPVAEKPTDIVPAPTAVEPTDAPPPPTVEKPSDTPISPTPAPPTSTPAPVPAPPTETPPPLAEHPGLPLPTNREELFSASGACAVCHTSMVDETGADVSVDKAWRSTMMANAARDPYWLAAVRGEVTSNPHLQAVIEDKCATCHMPMAHVSAVAEGGQGKVLDDGFLAPDETLHSLAMDGVSCTLCHQIRKDGLGEADSFGGGYVIDTELPAGAREAYGPYEVDEDLAQLMQSASGFIVLEGPHTSASELCATCHTLYTPYVDAAGEVAGVFPEQMAYFELQASSFSSMSCQGCHMPAADGGVQLSVTGGPSRSPFSQHQFVGGNVYVLEMLKRYGPDMSTTASSAQFQDTQQRVLEQLQKRSASMALDDAGLDGSTLTADVRVTTMVGHKFPTGFPSRRAWIHLTVEDAGGDVIFESGYANPDGSIQGNDNDSDPAAYEPHYRAIDEPDQVQIYEPIIGDTDGAVTTVLLRGAGYLKDNRLLPAGFDKTSAHEDIAVHGVALEDEDFAGGGDVIQYAIDVGDASGPFVVTAELLYQPIGFRWADNVRLYEGPEPARFVGYYEQVSNQPVVVATATAEVGE